MPEEERNQVSHPAFKEATDQQSECGGQQEKDNDEDICNRGREIGPELPFCDSPNRLHAAVLVSGSVMARKTSSSRPSSILMFSTFPLLPPPKATRSGRIWPFGVRPSRNRLAPVGKKCDFE